MGTIHTRCAMIAVFQDGDSPTAVNDSSSANPSTGCGKKIGSSSRRRKRPLPVQS